MLLRLLKKRPAERARPPAADPFEPIHASIRDGRYTHALAAIDRLAERSRTTAEAAYLRAIALHRLGEGAAALESARQAAALEPERAEYQRIAAHLWNDAGNLAEARRHCELALAAEPDHLRTHKLLAAITLPGSDYFDLLARIHAHLRPRTYVEIGVFVGSSFRLVDPATLAIGVDPEPRYALPAGSTHRIFSQTSDSFFAAHDLRALLGGLPVDLAFIDGMHQFEYALRDFAHLERFCDRNGTILVHDCYPLDARTAARERSTEFWSGDIWRLVLALKKHRPDLSIHTVGAPPTGLAIIRNLDPGSQVIASNMASICAEFLAVDFDALADSKPERLNLFPNDWEKIRALLPDPIR
jgi:tetratricopeptide (TPR) repeat protein